MEVLNHLRYQIQKHRRASASRRRYIDAASLPSLFAKVDMTKVCKECGVPEHNCHEYGKKILQSGYIIFAILLSIAQEGKMIQFIEHRVHNDRLPLSKETLEEITPDIANEFSEAQWTFKPFVLDRGHQEIDRNFIIPYDESTHLSDLDGSYGDIYKVTLLTSMQKFTHTEVCLSMRTSMYFGLTRAFSRWIRLQ